MTALFDTHAHIFDEEFLPDLEDVLNRAEEANVKYITAIATSRESLERGLNYKPRKNLNIFHAAGIHPHDAAKENHAFLEKIYQEKDLLIAVGEIGLDYHYDNSPKETQRHVLEEQLKFAEKVNKPILIHCREAFDDFFSIYAPFEGKVKGIMHCFTGNKSELERSLDLGFYISLSAIPTFPKSQDLRALLPLIPKDRLVVETDAPFLAPAPYRGKRAEPAHVRLTASFIAETLKIPEEEFFALTTTNAKNFFCINKILKT